MKTKYSEDKNFYYEVFEKNNLYRIRYFLNISGDLAPSYTQICGTEASIFDDLAIAEKEAQRMLQKYEDNPGLFK